MFLLNECQNYIKNLEILISGEERERAADNVVVVADTCIDYIESTKEVSLDEKVELAAQLLESLGRCRALIEETEHRGFGYVWSFLRTPENVKKVTSAEGKVRAVIDGLKIRKERVAAAKKLAEDVQKAQEEQALVQKAQDERDLAELEADYQKTLEQQAKDFQEIEEWARQEKKGIEEKPEIKGRLTGADEEELRELEKECERAQEQEVQDLREIEALEGEEIIARASVEKKESTEKQEAKELEELEELEEELKQLSLEEKPPEKSSEEGGI